MARPKKAARVPESLVECDAEMQTYRGACTQVDRLTAERDEEVARVQTSYEQDIDAWKRRRDQAEAALRAYYYAHAKEIEGEGRKFVEVASGRFGRRDNPPALKPLNRSWTWEKIEAAVKAWAGEKWRQWFRVPAPEPELDKDRLKDAKLAAETLAQLGVKVVAGETFYVEPAGLPKEGE